MTMTRTLGVLAVTVLACAACQDRIKAGYLLETRQNNQLYVGVSKVEIMPVPYEKDGFCPKGMFCYETNTNLGAADGCPKNKDNVFDGKLNDPKGGGCVEPWHDANGNGVFDGLWLGGYNMARPASASDREVSIYAKVLAMTFNDQYVVLINLPFAGFPTMQLSFLRERIAAQSGGTISKERIIPMLIHNHGVPDVQGLWGPDLLANYGLATSKDSDLQTVMTVLGDLFDGVQFPLPAMNYRNNAYWFWVTERVVEAVHRAVERLEPVDIRYGVRETPHRETGCQTKPFEGTVELDCDGDGVINENEDIGAYAGGDLSGDCLKKADYTKPVRFLVEDLRMPFALDYNVYTMQFVPRSTEGTLATFIVWGHHVEEADRENTKITGDIAESACNMVEQRVGGVCIFQVGPEGGLTSSNSGAIPYVDAKGFYHDCSGKPYPGSDKSDDYLAYLDKGELKLERTNYQDAISVGRSVAKTSLRSLELNPTVYRVSSMKEKHLHALLPLDNPFLYLAGRIEIMTGMSLLLRKEIDREQGAKIKDIVFRGELGKNNDVCGGAACIRALFSFFELELADPKKGSRRIAFATAPGELFPEYHIGRKKSSFFWERIASSSTLKGMADISKASNYPLDMFSPNINPQVFVEVTGLREVGKSLGYDELWVLAEANGSFGYMMPRTDYLPVFEGYFNLIGVIVPIFDAILKENGGIHKVYRLPDGDQNVTMKEILNDINERYLIYVQNYRPPGGGEVNVMDHPNAYEEEVSLGPRTGDIVYNAMYGLMTSGKYVTKRSVPKDPNTDGEVLSLGKLE